MKALLRDVLCEDSLALGQQVTEDANIVQMLVIHDTLNSEASVKTASIRGQVLALRGALSTDVMILPSLLPGVHRILWVHLPGLSIHPIQRGRSVRTQVNVAEVMKGKMS